MFTIFISCTCKIKVEYVSKNKRGSIVLNFNKREGYLLKPKTWCKIKFLTKMLFFSLLVTKEFEFNDYIESYQEF